MPILTLVVDYIKQWDTPETRKKIEMGYCHAPIEAFIPVPNIENREAVKTYIEKFLASKNISAEEFAKQSKYVDFEPAIIYKTDGAYNWQNFELAHVIAMAMKE